jgi:hypothetical protein
MRSIVCTVVLFGCLSFVASAQSGGGATAIKACSLLSRELVIKVTPGNNQRVDNIKPNEGPIGTTGSACEWGDLLVQIDPFTPARLDEMRKSTGKNWEPVPGVGDATYFHNIQGILAELLGRIGTHTFGIQLTVPAGSTVSATKANTIIVANAIVPKLK